MFLFQSGTVSFAVCSVAVSHDDGAPLCTTKQPDLGFLESPCIVPTQVKRSAQAELQRSEEDRKFRSQELADSRDRISEVQLRRSDALLELALDHVLQGRYCLAPPPPL